MRKIETLGPAAEPEVTGAGNGPRREAQQHERARLRLFGGGGAHGRLVYLILRARPARHRRTNHPCDRGAERHARGRADPVGGRVAGRPFVERASPRVGSDRDEQDGAPAASAAADAVPLHRLVVGRRRSGAAARAIAATAAPDVDPRAARADRHLRRPQVIRPLGQLMADRAADGVDRDRAAPVAERRRVRPARQRTARAAAASAHATAAATNARPEHESTSTAGWYTLAHDLAVRRDTWPASRSSPPRS